MHPASNPRLPLHPSSSGERHHRRQLQADPTEYGLHAPGAHHCVCATNLALLWPCSQEGRPAVPWPLTSTYSPAIQHGSSVLLSVFCSNAAAAAAVGPQLGERESRPAGFVKTVAGLARYGCMAGALALYSIVISSEDGQSIPLALPRAGFTAYLSLDVVL
jgi:hypothetical protein